MLEKENKLEKAKEGLVEEYKSNLKSYLENIKEQLSQKLEKNNELSILEIKNLLSKRTVIGPIPKYTNEELAILFDYYKQFIQEINKTQTYLPTKKDFCSFIGISSATYNTYMQSEDSQKREIIQMIDDYITDVMLTSAQNGDLKEISTIFRSKAEHGMVEASAPVVIEHKTETNMDTILKQIQAVNQGRSLKTIELKQDEHGVYQGGTNEN